MKPFQFFLILWTLLLGTFCATAAEHESSQEKPTLTYRQWMVPHDKVDDWPSGGEKLIPIKYDLFNYWIGLFEQKSYDNNETDTDTLERIVLHGRLEGRQIVEGKGFLDFRIPSLESKSDNFSSAPTQDLTSRDPDSVTDSFIVFYSLPLDPWGLWIGSPTWQNGTASIARSADGQMRLLLTTSDNDPTTPDPPSPPPTPLSPLHFPHSPNTPHSTLNFLWSLRSRTDAQGRLQFDFVLPPSNGFELNLDLPSFMVPSTPVGIVMDVTEGREEGRTGEVTPANNTNHEAGPNTSFALGAETGHLSTFRRWRILLGRHSRASLTISIDEKIIEAQQKTGVRQTIVYKIAPQGTEVTAKFFFDTADAFVNELLLDLEPTLRLKEILYEDKKVPWTFLTVGDTVSPTRVRVNLADVAKGEIGELSLVALAPVFDHCDWDLPRIRIASTNIFWKGTRCGLSVQNPLRIRQLHAQRAVQVTPTTTSALEERELFAFQFFEDDAQVSILLDYYVPKIILNSAVQVQWGGNEISGTMIVDCKINEGDRYSFEFPVSPNWTIHSVTSLFWDDILFWDIVEDKKSIPDESSGPTEPTTAGRNAREMESVHERKLVIQLKRPFSPKESLRFQMMGHFLAHSQSEFKLADVSPLSIPRRQGESHFIAIRPETPYHLQLLSTLSPDHEIRAPFDFRLAERFVDPPIGTVLPINMGTQEIRFRMERLRPNYTATLSSKVQLKENEIVSDFTIRCIPTDSAVDRIYVYFTSSPNSHSTWQWSGSTDLLQSFYTRKLAPDEVRELLPTLNIAPLPEGVEQGELWEVQLAHSRTSPFFIRAVSTIPMLGDTVPIPLAFVPGASTQRGVISINSPRLYPYHIINSRLQSVPMPIGEWYRYEETRAAFRYNPEEEFSGVPHSPLTLKKISSQDAPPAAWAWTLRLDSQYDSDGTVKNNAVFFLENRGKDAIHICLPQDVPPEDIHAVWLNDKWTSWRLDEKERKVIVVALPEGARFASVSVEYTYQDVPLTQRRRLNPKFPSADVPILSGTGTSWFPPEFDISSRNGATRRFFSSGPKLSRALDAFFSSFHFDPFSTASWRKIFQGGRQRSDAIQVSKTFLNWISAETEIVRERPGPTDTTPMRDGDRFVTSSGIASPEIYERDTKFKWSDLFERTKNLIAMQNQVDMNEGKTILTNLRRLGNENTRVRIMVDRQALTHYGIVPSTPISLPNFSNVGKMGCDILDQNGLVLLIAPGREKGTHVLYLTSFLMSALHRHFGSEPIGNCIRYLADDTALYKNVEQDALIVPDNNAPEQIYPTINIGNPQWITASDWKAGSESMVFPWYISSQMIRLASITPDWLAFEVPREKDSTLYIVHGNTYAAYRWLAFLAVVVLTWKRPFSSPAILVLLMILFEIWARSVPPCYLAVPSGAFFGAVISLCFSMVRSRSSRKGMRRVRIQNQDSSSTPFGPIGYSDTGDDSSILDPGTQSFRDSEKGNYSKTELDPTDPPVQDPWDGKSSNVVHEDKNVKSSGQNFHKHLIGTEILLSRLTHEMSDSDGVDNREGQKNKKENGKGNTQTSPEENSLEGPLPSGKDEPTGLRPLALVGFIFCCLVGAATTQADPPYGTSPSESTKAPSNVSSSVPVMRISEDSSGANSTENITKPPYRVFFPVDETQNRIGNFVFLPEEFYLTLHQYARNFSPEARHRWNIGRARYEGNLAYHHLTQNLTIINFKAVFELVLEEENATIILPSLPLLQDGALWDSSPIQPTWRILEKAPGADEPGRNSVLVFQVENVRKGLHVLELALDPKPVRSEDSNRVSFEIPKIPNSVLKLNLPANAPVVNVSDCMGAVSVNSFQAPTLTAEIGPSEKLTFSWSGQSFPNDTTSVDVDSLFWMQARLNPVVIWAKFRYRVDGGKIQHVNLMMDPHWPLSGQFHCEEYPIERVETYYEPIRTDNAFFPHGEVTRLVFKTPVSGQFTIRAGFILKDFSGIGKIRLPQILALNASRGRALLAVSADPLLELDLPQNGFSTGFQSSWNGNATTDLVPETKNFSLAPSTDPGLNAVTIMQDEGRPLAEYDLNKVDPSWTLSIRTKNILPKLTLTQSYRFDFGDSTLYAVGNFTCPQKVFRQSFSVPNSLDVESIEVRDSQEGAVDIRWPLPEPGTEMGDDGRRQGTIFFRHPVSGQYRVTVLGHFPSKAHSAVDAESEKISATSVPVLSFDNVQMESHRLEFFRTAAMIAVVETEGTDWVRSEVAPVTPKIFSGDLVVGAWKSSLYPPSLSRDETGSSVGPDLGPEKATSILTYLSDKEPEFLLMQNRPTIRSEIVSTLHRNNVSDSWGITFDVLCDISQGELDSIRFLWDDRCSILSVEPPIPFSFEQRSGRSQLRLSPRTPFFGKRHIRIKATMNTVGNAISVLKMIPVFDRAAHSELENYVILPSASDGESIPWTCSMLEPVDDDKIDFLKEITNKSFKDDKDPVLSSPKIVVEASESGYSSVLSLVEPKWERPINVQRDSPMYLRATGNNFSASITPKNIRPVATLYDVNLFIRNSGDLFGMATFDLKAQGSDSFVLALPPSAELIQVVAVGIATEATRLSERRWKIELCASDYPQRIGVLFRGSLASTAASDSKSGRHSFLLRSKSGGENPSVRILLPELENVDVRETLWTLSFERDTIALPSVFSVSTVRTKRAATAGNLSVPMKNRENVDSLGRYPLVSGLEAAQTLIKVDMVRLNNLLSVLDSVPPPTPLKMDDVKNWYSHWLNEWTAIVRLIDTQAARFPAAFHSDEHTILMDTMDQRSDDITGRDVVSFIDDLVKKPDYSFQGLKVRQRKAGELLGLDDGDRARRTSFSSGNSLTQYREKMGGNAAHLFGVSAGQIEELRLVSVPAPLRWSERLWNYKILWLPILIIPVFFFRRLRFVGGALNSRMFGAP